MKWKDVQDNCEKRIRELVKLREERKVKDLKTWRSNVESNEDMRKVAIEAQGERYGGKYLKIDGGQRGITSYHISGSERTEAGTSLGYS